MKKFSFIVILAFMYASCNPPKEKSITNANKDSIDTDSVTKSGMLKFIEEEK
jgi:hypothetical protein